MAALSYSGYSFIVAGIIEAERFAVFAAVDTVSKIFNVLVMGVLNIATPLVARSFQDSRANFLKNVQAIRLYGTIVVLALAITVYSSRSTIFEIVFAGRFTNYDKIMLMMLVANVMFFLQAISVMTAKVYENTRIVFLARIISSLFAMTLGIFLASHFSVEGMALSIALHATITVLMLTTLNRSNQKG